MSLAILIHFLCAQHVSDINISIIRSLRLFCWITTLVVLFLVLATIQQNSRKLLMMDILISETCWAHKKWNKLASDIKLVFYSSTITMMHGAINIRFILLLFSLLHIGLFLFNGFQSPGCLNKILSKPSIVLNLIFLRIFIKDYKPWRS